MDSYFYIPPCAIGINMSNLSCFPTKMMFLFSYIFNKSDFSISLVSDFASVLYATCQGTVSFSCITPPTFVKDVTNTLSSDQTLLKKPSKSYLPDLNHSTVNDIFDATYCNWCLSYVCTKDNFPHSPWSWPKYIQLLMSWQRWIQRVNFKTRAFALQILRTKILSQEHLSRYSVNNRK